MKVNSFKVLLCAGLSCSALLLSTAYADETVSEPEMSSETGTAFESEVTTSAGETASEPEVIASTEIAPTEIAPTEIAPTEIAPTEIASGTEISSEPETRERQSTRGCGVQGVSRIDGANLTVTLLDWQHQATQKSISVQAEVEGIELLDPITVRDTPQAGQGHLRFQLDDYPVSASIWPRLDFHNVPSGSHVITVYVVNHDRSPITLATQVCVKIP